MATATDAVVRQRFPRAYASLNKLSGAPGRVLESAGPVGLFAIQAIGQSPVPDMLVIGRLKRKKLALKDQIQRLKDQLTPDIIA